MKRKALPSLSPVEAELAYLAELASTGRLAAYLESWGEVGAPGVSCYCVLANHLWRRLELDVEVTYRRTGDPARLEVLDGNGSLLAALPVPLAKFVRDFDAHAHPSLEVSLESQSPNGPDAQPDGIHPATDGDGEPADLPVGPTGGR